MNKRGFIKYIFVFIAVFISLYFMGEMVYKLGIDGFSLVILFNLLLVLTIYMYSIKDRIKKNKFVYDVILILLIIFSMLWFLYLIFSYVICFFNYNCTPDFKNYF